MRFNFNLAALFLVLTLLVMGCGPSTNKEKIIGSWEAVFDKNEGQPSSTRKAGRKMTLQFNADLTLNSQVFIEGKVDGNYAATYDFENDQKNLVVYREGRKNRKNVAAIVKLTGSEMTLVDVSGAGDTVHFRKLK